MKAEKEVMASKIDKLRKASVRVPEMLQEI